VRRSKGTKNMRWRGGWSGEQIARDARKGGVGRRETVLLGMGGRKCEGEGFGPLRKGVESVDTSAGKSFKKGV